MRMNIGGRIALTIGVLVFLMFVTSIATLFVVKRLEDGIMRYTTLDAPRERAALRLQALLSEYEALVAGTVKARAPAPDRLAELVGEFDQTAKKLAGWKTALQARDVVQRMHRLDRLARVAIAAPTSHRNKTLSAFQEQYRALNAWFKTDVLRRTQSGNILRLLDLQNLAAQPRYALSLMAGVSGIIGAMAAIVLLRGVLYPISDILSQTRALADSDQTGNIDIEGDDELSQLAAAINTALEKRQAQGMALEQLGHLDPLTALPNRRLFSDRLKETIEHARRSGDQVAVYVIDIDNFKDLNDTLGHDAGDSLLLQVAERLQEATRETDMVARLGGDEFAIIRSHANHQDSVGNFANRIISGLARAYLINDSQLHTTASVGVTIFPDDVNDSSQLLQNAELALYRAKEEGRGRFQLFDSDMQASVRRRHELEGILRQALDNGGLEVHYQPRYSADDRRIVGAEALVRLNDPAHGHISPAEFVPVAESTGLITKITDVVMQTACRDMAEWSRKFQDHLVLSVNLSPVDFRRPDIVEYIGQNLADSGLPATQLEVEITEGMVMYGAELVRGKLAEIRKLGVSLAIDDFGTGFSSMSYLKEFPFDALKVDQSFIAGIPSHPEDAAITMAILRLAQSLNLKTVAEGVETEEQFKFLMERNCDQFQGFLFSKAVPKPLFEALLQTD